MVQTDPSSQILTYFLANLATIEKNFFYIDLIWRA